MVLVGLDEPVGFTGDFLFTHSEQDLKGPLSAGVKVFSDLVDKVHCLFVWYSTISMPDSPLVSPERRTYRSEAFPRPKSFLRKTRF